MQPTRRPCCPTPVYLLALATVVAPALGCDSDHFLGDLEPVDLTDNGADAHRTAAHSDFSAPTLLDPPDVTMDAETWGWSPNVASVGDVDGDGYGDFAATSKDNSGMHFVHLRYGGPRPEDAQAAFALAAGGARLTLDTSPWHIFIETITGVGDVDGDGRDDFLVGLGRCNPTAEGEGAYLVYGGTKRLEGVQRLDATAVFLKGTRPVGSRHDVGACEVGPAGSFAAALGDFDGDGLDDFIVTEPRLIPLDNYPEPGPVMESVAYLFYGHRERIATGTSLASADARLHAEQDLVLTPTGDVNADGRGDLILGNFGSPRASADDGAPVEDERPPENWWNVRAPTAYYWLPGRAERLIGDVDLESTSGPAALAMAAGDLDGDGVSDVVLYDDVYLPHLFYGTEGLFDTGVDFSQAAARFSSYGLDFESIGGLVRLNDRDGDGDDELGLIQFLQQKFIPPEQAALLGGTSSRRSGEVGVLPPGNPFEVYNDRLFLEGVFPVGDLDGDGAGDLVTFSSQYGPRDQDDGSYDIESLQYDRIRDQTWLNIHYGKPGGVSAPVH